MRKKISQYVMLALRINIILACRLLHNDNKPKPQCVAFGSLVRPDIGPSERKTESTSLKMNSGSFAAHLRNK